MTSANLNQSSKNKPTAFGLKRVGAASLAGSLAFGMLAFAGISPAAAAEPTVMLGTAGGFAVLAGTTVTNTGPSVLNQNLGLHPGSDVTGFPPGLVNGVIHSADSPASIAKSDLLTAYDDAALRPATAQVTDELSGLTLVGGVYESANGPLQLNGVLTLDGANDPSSVFILQSDSTLITGAASRINLINGAQACNVFWQVGSSATIGSGSSFAGSILALTSITAETGAVIEGRALARNGAVTLDTNVFTAPGCDMTVPDEDVPPVEEDTPPVDEDTPPVEEDAPPVDEDTPPVDEDTPPVDENAPPADENAPPVNGTPPTDENAPPVNEEAPPVNGTPPADENSPPVNEEIPPADEETPPGDGTPPGDSSKPELPHTGASSMTPWFAGGGALLLLAGLGLIFSNRFVKFGGSN